MFYNCFLHCLIFFVKNKSKVLPKKNSIESKTFILEENKASKRAHQQQKEAITTKIDHIKNHQQVLFLTCKLKKRTKQIKNDVVAVDDVFKKLIKFVFLQKG